MSVHPLIRAAALVALLAVPAEAQRRGDQDFDRPPGPPRGAFGGSFSYARPVDEFLQYVNRGYGFDAFFRWNFDQQGIFGIRLDGGFLGYGRETKRVPLSSTIGGRIQVDLTTSNNILWFGLGPQVTIPMPGIRPYANAAVGFSYFFTESSVEGIADDDDLFTTKNYDDGTFAWGAGGGILIPFQTRSGEIAIDLGVRYHGNGEVRYLREGGIEDLPDGSILLHPIQSEANLLTYRLGISIGIR